MALKPACASSDWETDGGDGGVGLGAGITEGHVTAGADV